MSISVVSCLFNIEGGPMGLVFTVSTLNLGSCMISGPRSVSESFMKVEKLRSLPFLTVLFVEMFSGSTNVRSKVI